MAATGLVVNPYSGVVHPALVQARRALHPVAGVRRDAQRQAVPTLQARRGGVPVTKVGRRVIARDACTWCGHQHEQTCTASIRVKSKPETSAPCPCARPLVVVA